MKLRFLLFLVVALSLCACATEANAGERFDHIVVVFEENKSATEVSTLPYLSSLQTQGVVFTNSFGLYRPSQPNYIAFFSGSAQGVTDNADHDISADNLYTRLRDRGATFLSYSQSMPGFGFRHSSFGAYRRKHNPAASFTTVPDAINRPFDEFPRDAAGFASLPSVSFVIPDLDNDMHDGTPGQGDTWLQDNLDAYAQWAQSNRSLLIVTFDEPATSPVYVDIATTPILTIFVGAGLTPLATVTQRVTHYTLLKFLLDEFGAPSLGLDAGEAQIVLP